MNYYNENDQKAAGWLRELIAAGLVPDGDVDERSIIDVRAGDLDGYCQKHFFAGIGGWAHALSLAGWPEDRPVWTGSCPCQPFSVAGHGKGAGDERHLWPVFFDLVRQCEPEYVFGEQVARAIGFNWLDGISADLEGAGYAVGSIVLGAHSVGAPHIRQRLYWGARRMGNSVITGFGGGDERGIDQGGPEMGEPENRTGVADQSGDGCQDADRVADSEQPGLEGFAGDGRDGHQPGRQRAQQTGSTSPSSTTCGLGESQGQRESPITRSSQEGIYKLNGTSPQHNFWSDYTLIPCRDGKARRAQRGLQCLAYGVPDWVVPGSDPGTQEAQATSEARTMRLRGYGNAITPQLAAEFVRAFMDQ